MIDLDKPKFSKALDHMYCLGVKAEALNTTFNSWPIEIINGYIMAFDLDDIHRSKLRDAYWRGYKDNADKAYASLGSVSLDSIKDLLDDYKRLTNG